MPGLPLRIRNFHAEDFDELYRIDQVCFPPDIAFTRGEIVFYLSHPKSMAWLAEWDGRILGFVLARVEDGSRAHVLTLDVVPDVRQHGIGTALMKRLHQELRKQRIGLSILEVGVLNTPARRLYEKLQYRYEATLAGYYRGREDAYRMVKAVASSQ